MERNIRNGIDLGIERDQMIRSCDVGKRIAQDEARNDSGGFISDGHGKHDENIEAGDESDQADKNGGDQFFEAKRAKEGAIFFHPRGGDETLASGVFKDRREFASFFWLGEANLENVDDVTGAGERLRRGKRDEAPVFVVVVEAGIENAGDAKTAGTGHEAEGRQAALRAGQGDVIAGTQFPVIGELLANEQAFDTVGVGREVELTCG